MIELHCAHVLFLNEKGDGQTVMIFFPTENEMEIDTMVIVVYTTLIFYTRIIIQSRVVLAALDPKSGRIRVLAILVSPSLHALCLAALSRPSRAHDRCWNGGMHADGTANSEIEIKVSTIEMLLK
jgi:hypothetical protein